MSTLDVVCAPSLDRFSEFFGFCSSWQRFPISLLILIQDSANGSVSPTFVRLVIHSPPLTRPPLIAGHMATSAIQACMVDFSALCLLLFRCVFFCGVSSCAGAVRASCSSVCLGRGVLCGLGQTRVGWERRGGHSTATSSRPWLMRQWRLRLRSERCV
jgi:hypothetical protein